MTVQLRFAAFSDIGLTRSSNQDSGYASPHLLVLADGMGGEAGGDIASSVTVGHLVAIDDDVHASDELLPLLRGALKDANDELRERAAENPALHHMGTTCIAILRANNKLAMVHIGDSRAYLLRDGSLTQVTKDHTFVQYLIDKGDLTPEEAEHHPKRNAVMKIIGDYSDMFEPDESIREAIPGDRWLLCSDGLSGVVSAETIAATLYSEKDLDACGEKLIQLALAAGAPDNVTVVLADVVEGDDDAPTQPVIVGAAAIEWKDPSRGGSSAAAKAAALTSALRTPAPGAVDPAQAKRETIEALHELDKKETRRRPWLSWLIAAIVVLVVASGCLIGWRWSQSQYYVAVEKGTVVIYQGIPQHIGPLSLSHPYEKTDLKMDELTQLAQDRLARPITRASLDEARQVVEDLRKQLKPSTSEGVVIPPTPAATPTPAPTAAPSPAPTTGSTPR